MFIFFHSIKTNIRTIRREVFEYSNNIWNFKVARIQIRIEIFVKNYSNIQIIRIFVTTPTCTCPPPRWPATGTGSTWPRHPASWWTVGSTWRERGVSYVYITLKSPSSSHLQVLLQSCHEPYLTKFVKEVKWICLFTFIGEKILLRIDVSNPHGGSNIV